MLIIGVDDYPHVGKLLQGAVADTDAMVDFLITTMRVSRSRIQRLTNNEATRVAIGGSIFKLASRLDIKNYDPILIYYAGHGAEADPPKG